MFYLIQSESEQVTRYINMMCIGNKENRMNYFINQKNMLEFQFYTDEMKKELKLYFEKNARMKFLCNKFYIKIKNRLIKYGNETDLYCNNISEDNHNLIILQRKDFVWRFDPQQLKELIESSLNYTSYLMPEPKEPKNPYTNKLFNILEISYIYKKLKKLNMTTIYLDLFKKYNFNIKQFSKYCFRMLKKDGVINTVKNWSYEDEDLILNLNDVYQAERYRLGGICRYCLIESIKKSPTILNIIKKLIIYNYVDFNEDRYTYYINTLIDEYQEYMNDGNPCVHNKPPTSLLNLAIDDMEFNIGTN